MAAPADELVLEQIEGRNVKTVVPAGAVLQLKDLQLSRTGRAIAIKKGENVKVVAINGKLRIQMMQVEAMQDGGIGEVIELRNERLARPSLEKSRRRVVQWFGFDVGVEIE